MRLQISGGKRQNEHPKPPSIFFDGAGCRPGGEGSGFAWCCPETGEKHVERLPGLTNNQAEYRAFISALEALPNGGRADMFSDSQLVCFQFSGDYKTEDPTLATLLATARDLIKKKRLQIALCWIRRVQNLAGKLL